MRYTRLFLLSLLAAALLGAGALASCSAAPEPLEGDDGEAAEARRDVLAHLGEHVILATYEDFEARTAALETAASAYADSQSDQDRQVLRQAWIEAVDVWQRAEMFQIGPAGVMDQVVGGEDLRDQLYSWPIVNRCRVDQEIVDQEFTDPQAFASQPVNVRGLDALEYLLFHEGTDNDCAPNSTINTDGSWDELDEAELRQRRATYAHTLAIDLHSRATQLREAWDADGGDFLAEFARAGASSETYATSQEALNAVSDAMFYLDKETKDMKLAEPVGLIECVEDVCPDARESHHADRSLVHVRNNLVGFRLLYHGGELDDEAAHGFDHLLRSMGAADLADDMAGRIDAAIAAIDAIDGTMAQALEDDPDSVVAAYDAIKDVTDLFKSQFFDVLDLEVPKRGEGDND